MSSFRAKALVEIIGSPLVVTEPDQGRVASPGTTAAEHSLNKHHGEMFGLSSGHRGKAQD